MKKLLIIVMLTLVAPAWSQFSINGGGSLLVGFGAPRAWQGIHIGFEVPRDDALSFYGRITHHFFQGDQDSISLLATAIDPTTTPNAINFRGLPSMNYTILEGGTRYYLGNGFDYGWAAYGGTKLMLLFNSVRMKRQSDAFDESLYEIDAQSGREGAIFSLGGGFAGGVKYSLPRVGTFYTDISLGYMLLAQASNAGVYSQLYRPLVFDFTIGYRKDILW